MSSAPWAGSAHGIERRCLHPYAAQPMQRVVARGRDPGQSANLGQKVHTGIVILIFLRLSAVPVAG